MFTGFTPETFQFFLAIGFNNNTEFFEENRALYDRAVKAPLYELARALAPTIAEIDPKLETRPEKVVSRIRRDTRFTRDKSPYRDHMWLGFRRAGEDKAQCFGLYFDLYEHSCHWGAGFYGENKPWMNLLRAQLAKDASAFEQIVNDPAFAAHYRFEGERYKRLALPPGIPEPLAALCMHRGFYVEHTRGVDEALLGARILEEICEGLLRVRPLYRYMYALKGE